MKMCFRFYADFTGADPRCRDPKPKTTPKTGASPAWEGEPEPLRSKP